MALLVQAQGVDNPAQPLGGGVENPSSKEDGVRWEAVGRVWLWDANFAYLGFTAKFCFLIEKRKTGPGFCYKMTFLV